jgi:hypothetical protein
MFAYVRICADNLEKSFSRIGGLRDQRDGNDQTILNDRRAAEFEQVWVSLTKYGQIIFVNREMGMGEVVTKLR